MSKTILVMGISLAFIAGTIASGTMAFASGDKNGKPFEEIWAALHVLEEAIYENEPIEGPPTDLSELQAQVDELETQMASLQNPSIEVRRVQATQLIPVGPGTTLLQTPECNSDEFVHSFGYSQNIDGQSLGTNAQPPDTVILTPTKLAVRVGNTLDEPYNLNLDLWCGKLVQP
jgi:hypothetical protein